MTNYITPNANYDLFSTASYAALDTYLKNDAIVKFKTVLDTVTSMFSSEILKCFEQKSSNSNPRNAGRRAYQPEFMFKLCLLQRRVNKADNDFVDSIYADVRYQYALGITDLNVYLALRPFGSSETSLIKQNSLKKSSTSLFPLLKMSMS